MKSIGLCAGFECHEVLGESKVQDLARHAVAWIHAQRFYTKHFGLASKHAGDPISISSNVAWNCNITIDSFTGRQGVFQNAIKASRTEILRLGFDLADHVAGETNGPTQTQTTFLPTFSAFHCFTKFWPQLST